MNQVCAIHLSNIETKGPGYQEDIIIISDIVEKYYSKPGDGFSSEFEEVRENEFSEADIDMIRKRLANVTLLADDYDLRASAVYVLGKIKDESIFPTLQAILTATLTEIMQRHLVLAQCLGAMGKHDHTIISNGQFSANNIVKNISDALEYAKRNQIAGLE